MVKRDKDRRNQEEVEEGESGEVVLMGFVCIS